jgi:hypothetical protein
VQRVAAQNRLTGDQLAALALAPGDSVTIETSGDSRRPRHSAGTVVRLVGSCIVVSPRGVPYVHQFDRRTGVCIGGGHVAQLVTVDAADDTTTEQRRRLARVDAVYREWARNRTDVERLRLLQAAISECLEGHTVG